MEKRSAGVTFFSQKRGRQAEEERVRIIAERESEQGRQLVAEACACLPWRR